MLNPLNFISKFIKSSNQKELDRLKKIVEQVNTYEDFTAKLKDSEGKPTTGNTFYGVNKTLNSNNISVGNQIDDVISEIIGG